MMIRLLRILFATLLAGCGQPKQTLNVLTFTDYIDPKVRHDPRGAVGRARRAIQPAVRAVCHTGW